MTWVHFKFTVILPSFYLKQTLQFAPWNEKIMNILKINPHIRPRHRHQSKLWPEFQFHTSPERNFKLSPSFARPLFSVKNVRAVKVCAAIPFAIDNIKEEESEDFEDYLAEDGEVYQKTLRLVECAMFAAVSALAFLLSNSLAIEVIFLFWFLLTPIYIFGVNYQNFISVF